MEVRCKGLNIVITIIIIIKRPLLKPLRAVLGNMKYSDSKEPDIPYHKKKRSVTDFWGKPKAATYIPPCSLPLNVYSEPRGPQTTFKCPTPCSKLQMLSVFLRGLFSPWMHFDTRKFVHWILAFHKPQVWHSLSFDTLVTECGKKFLLCSGTFEWRGQRKSQST